MVRFILTDDNATLSSGIYTYSLDTRLSNASFLQLKKCSFQLTTTGTAPIAVFIRSKAFHRIGGSKHTLVLKSNNHQDSSDILAVLEESHTTGRYQLRGIPRPVPLRYTHLRELDLYFTKPDGTNVISGSGSSGSSSDLLTAADIAARSDLQSFINFSDSTKITQSNATTLTGFEAVNDATQAFTATNGTAVGFTDIGTNGGKTISFSADWIRFTDSTGFTEPSSGTCVVLFRTQPVQDQYVIFKWGKFRAYADNGKLSFDPAISNAKTTMILQNSQDYILTLTLDGTKTASEYGGFTYRLEDLGNFTAQSYRGVHHGQSTGGQYEYGGVSNHSAAGTQVSNLVMTTALSAVDQAKMELYMRNYHTAQTAIRTYFDYYPMEDNMDSPTDQAKWFNICRCFDTGGTAGQYGSNEALNRLYYTVSGSPMSIIFISYQTETNYDKLSIFSINADGSFDTANPLVNEYSGGPQLPGGGAVITGSAGSIGIKFQWASDGSNNQNGWEALAWDSSLTTFGGSPPTYVRVDLPANLQLNPSNGSGAEESNTGSFVAEFDINTK